MTSLKKLDEEDKVRDIKETINSRDGLEKGSDNNMNNSFHIRKKKTVKKEEVMVVNITTLGEWKIYGVFCVIFFYVYPILQSNKITL